MGAMAGFWGAAWVGLPVEDLDGSPVDGLNGAKIKHYCAWATGLQLTEIGALTITPV